MFDSFRLEVKIGSVFPKYAPIEEMYFFFHHFFISDTTKPNLKDFCENLGWNLVFLLEVQTA